LFCELLVEFIENLQKLRGKMEDFR
jgi:hypothetical protein